MGCCEMYDIIRERYSNPSSLRRVEQALFLVCYLLETVIARTLRLLFISVTRENGSSNLRVLA